jgi:GTP-binding protein
LRKERETAFSKMAGGQGLRRVLIGASANIGACFTREQLRTNLSVINKTLLPEVAVVGRSNCGKSSIINALLGRTKAKTMACRVGKKPGVTQSLQMFACETDWKKKRQFIMSDLPGYGYAKADKYKIKEMSHVVGKYIQHSERLKRVLLLVDFSAGITVNDRWMMELLKHENRKYQIVITKCDKAAPNDLRVLMRKIENFVEEDAGPDNQFPVIATSTKNGLGIALLRTHVRTRRSSMMLPRQRISKKNLQRKDSVLIN